MKINRKTLVFWAVTMLFFLPALCLAQDEMQGANSSDNNTNTPPTLKELMASNNVVTNTVGIALVKISPTLWAGKYEVTQNAYQKVMGGNPSAFPGGNHPVDSVTWNDAVAFCQKLTDKEQAAKELPDGWIYTLPTQAQWMRLVDNASLNDAVMSLKLQHRSSTAPVGSLGPNGLGLYDTRGNVMEWCLDPQDKPYRVLRGGGWDTYIDINARLEFREYCAPDKTKDDYGFRVVLEPKDSQ
jgi:formylglycine-generating enzyme required for sulfatase activity